jgi:hypothetical protein
VPSVAVPVLGGVSSVSMFRRNHCCFLPLGSSSLSCALGFRYGLGLWVEQHGLSIVVLPRRRQATHEHACLRPRACLHAAHLHHLDKGMGLSDKRIPDCGPHVGAVLLEVRVPLLDSPDDLIQCQLLVGPHDLAGHCTSEGCAHMTACPRAPHAGTA